MQLFPRGLQKIDRTGCDLMELSRVEFVGLDGVMDLKNEKELDKVSSTLLKLIQENELAMVIFGEKLYDRDFYGPRLPEALDYRNWNGLSLSRDRQSSNKLGQILPFFRGVRILPTVPPSLVPQQAPNLKF